jgi:two-component system nitrogen regulation response regulator GlnG
LSHFGFPGNVRQLENICHWLTVMAPAQVIEPKDLPPEVWASADHTSSAKAADPALDSGVGAGDLPLHARPGGTASAELPATALEAQAAEGSFPALIAPALNGWDVDMAEKARVLLEAGHPDVWDALTRQFESRLILAALAHTKGRRIEAAQKLGIGRNTITRKIQDLGLE